VVLVHSEYVPPDPAPKYVANGDNLSLDLGAAAADVRFVQSTLFEAFEGGPVQMELALEAATRRLALLEGRLLEAGLDELTGLPLRKAFFAAFDAALVAAANAGTPVHLFYVDLKKLKDLNSAVGHHYADRAFTAVADAGRSLQESLGADKVLLSRIGGDEFAIVITGIDDQKAKSIRDEFRGNAFWNFAAVVAEDPVAYKLPGYTTSPLSGLDDPHYRDEVRAHTAKLFGADVGIVSHVWGPGNGADKNQMIVGNVVKQIRASLLKRGSDVMLAAKRLRDVGDAYARAKAAFADARTHYPQLKIDGFELRGLDAPAQTSRSASTRALRKAFTAIDALLGLSIDVGSEIAKDQANNPWVRTLMRNAPTDPAHPGRKAAYCDLAIIAQIRKYLDVVDDKFVLPKNVRNTHRQALDPIHRMLSFDYSSVTNDEVSAIGLTAPANGELLQSTGGREATINPVLDPSAGAGQVVDITDSAPNTSAPPPFTLA